MRKKIFNIIKRREFSGLTGIAMYQIAASFYEPPTSSNAIMQRAQPLLRREQ